MQSSGGIGDDVQILFEGEGSYPLLRLYWNASGLCRQQGPRCITVGKLPNPKGGEWVRVGLRVARGCGQAWVGETSAESDKIGGSGPRRLRIVQSSKSATYRNIRLRVLQSDPKYRAFYTRGKTGHR